MKDAKQEVGGPGTDQQEPHAVVVRDEPPAPLPAFAGAFDMVHLAIEGIHRQAAQFTPALTTGPHILPHLGDQRRFLPLGAGLRLGPTFGLRQAQQRG